MSNLKKYIQHVVKFQKSYLIGLAVVILLIPIIVNLALGKPLLMGSESYYHLQQTREFNIGNFYYFPLLLASLIIPPDLMVFIPFLLAISSILLLIAVTKESSLQGEFIFFFLLFMILSPEFIHNYSVLSANSALVFLAVLIIYLISRESKWVKIMSIFPLIAASFFNLFSTSLIILALAFYSYFTKKNRLIALILAALLFLSGLINLLALNQDVFPIEFQEQPLITGLISALGAVGGISFFILLLALIGLAVTWKKKFFWIAYVFLLILVGGYLFNQKLIFLMSIVITFLATVAFAFLARQEWKLPLIKNFTLFILLLGILFSTLSYLNRANLSYPLAAHEETLQWIKENTLPQALIFSSPEQIHYINYLAERRAFHNLYKDKEYAAGQYRAVIGALQLNGLISLLDIHQISIIYLTPDLKSSLPADYGLLALLNTENFKLVHSYQGIEVWFYSKIVNEEVKN